MIAESIGVMPLAKKTPVSKTPGFQRVSEGLYGVK